jgi:hypothetical protein
MEQPTSTYMANLIAETERAIRLLDVKEQKAYRILATQKLKQINNSPNYSNVLQKRQFYVIKGINKKLITENAIITQADKGKTIVIINHDEYSKKVNDFISANNSRTLTKNPTERFKKSIHKDMQESNLIIDKHRIKYLTQKKPNPPNLKAQLKLHKVNIPIRPIINNRPAPAYKSAKHLADILNQYITLKNPYFIISSHNLANDLIKLKINDNHNMVTFDTKDLYVNIPIEETLNIIKSKLLQQKTIK